MKQTISFFLFLLISQYNFSQKRAFVLYNEEGQQIEYDSLLQQIAPVDIVLFGELHNNAIAHWLEYEITKDLYDRRQLTLGAEMLEADNQDELDLYLNDEIDAEELDSLARLWSNYKTDYAPLVNFAKESNIPFIATNIPRRYANQVYKGGFEVLDSLSQEELNWVAPLPIPFEPELPGYQKILTSMGDHGSIELVKAQAIKDATMAHFILNNRKEDSLFLHFNGSWHSDYHDGIFWYLQKYEPDVSIATISTVNQDDISSLEKEFIGRADFIICVDEDVTKTY